MKNKIYGIMVLGLITIISIVVFAFRITHDRNVEKQVNSYIKKTYDIERKYIVNIPIYRDFTSPAREMKLRTYLFMAHLREVRKVASRYKIKPFRNDKDISNAVTKGQILNIDDDKNKLYYFHNVRKQYRYLTPLTKKGLEAITHRFQKNISRIKKGLPPVKLAISSVIRPVDYQKKLFNRAFVSTHSYGTTFDIFIDDYFVFLPKPKGLKDVSGKILKKLHRRLGFLMGDALRRQFHSILMETLTQLQDEGLLYAILEKKRRCYHITILNR
ncbi:DUF5715 family protein [Spirochaetota bacterium]